MNKIENTENMNTIINFELYFDQLTVFVVSKLSKNIAFLSVRGIEPHKNLF
jgi:hypothetical protein